MDCVQAEWHVATDEEWQTLEAYLGMDAADLSGTGYRGTDEGDRLKSAPTDLPSWDETGMKSDLRPWPQGNASILVVITGLEASP